MKVARFVLKIVALALSAAAAVCCIIAYWDKIAAFFQRLCGKLSARKPCCCHSEFDDYADWEE